MTLDFVRDGIRALQELMQCAEQRASSTFAPSSQFRIMSAHTCLQIKMRVTLPLIAAIHIAMTIRWVLAVFFIPLTATRIHAGAKKIV